MPIWKRKQTENEMRKEQALQAQEAHRQAQGRLTPQEARQKFPIRLGVPLLGYTSDDGQARFIGVEQEKVPGHVLLVASPEMRFLHLRHILWLWLGSGIVLDTDGKLLDATAARVTQLNGQAYTLPGHRLNLSAAYRIWKQPDAKRLHSYLMMPLTPEETIADRSIPLFQALGHFAYSRSLPVLQVVLDAAASPMLDVLNGLEANAKSKPFVRQFTGGIAPIEAVRNTAIANAYQLFARRINRYQPHCETYAMASGADMLPDEWTTGKGVLYTFYTPQTLHEIGGLIAATIAGVARWHMSKGSYKPFLLTLNADIARLIPDLALSLKVMRYYGIMVVLTVATLGELQTLAGDDGMDSFLSEFPHQIWYANGDLATAQKMSDLYGTQLRPLCPTCHHPAPPEAGQEGALASYLTEPVALPEHILAWPDEQPLIIIRQRQRYCFTDRWRLPPLAPTLPRPMRLSLAEEPRELTKWQPEVVLVPPQESPQAQKAAAAKPATQKSTAAKPEQGKKQTSTKPASGNASEPKVVRNNRGYK